MSPDALDTYRAVWKNVSFPPMLEPTVDARIPVRDADQTSSFKLRRSPEAVLAVFSETNEHMRNAEQKQLSITGAYLGVVAVVLSLLPSGGITILAPRAESAYVYLFSSLLGCCVFLLQAWCRVWKEHYLHILQNIAQTWLLPDDLLPYWLRGLPAAPLGAFHRFNVDNVLVYLTFVLNTTLVGLVAFQIVSLLHGPFAYALAVTLFVAYGLFLVGVRRLIENRRDLLRA